MKNNTLLTRKSNIITTVWLGVIVIIALTNCFITNRYVEAVGIVLSLGWFIYSLVDVYLINKEYSEKLKALDEEFEKLKDQMKKH